MSIIIPANTLAAGGFNVDNSCRFDGTSAYMSKTPGSNGDAQKMTTSIWFKRGVLGRDIRWFEMGDLMLYSGTNIIGFANRAFDFDVYTVSNFLMDTSAWYHIVWSVDTTQSTAANRVKIYVNGVLLTSANGLHADISYMDQNANLECNQQEVHRVGAVSTTAASFFDGYMAEFVHIDGTQLAADQFGEFDEDSNIWKPIDVSGLTFGTNGFYLDFKSSGNLGNDANGGTDLTETGLAATDQTTDTCTNNFSTLNPLYQQGDNAFSEGNCKVVLQAGDGTKGVASNIAVSSGKWYFEVKQGSSTNSVIQVREASDKEDDLSYYEGSYAGYQFNNGNQYITGNSSSAYGASYANEDIIMVALDMDNNRVYFGKNGSWNDGDGNADEANLNDYAPVNGVTNAIAAFANANGSATATAEFNFGNPPYANSSSVSDGNGFGNFEFAVPSGYFAICTKNLAEYG